MMPLIQVKLWTFGKLPIQKEEQYTDLHFRKYAHYVSFGHQTSLDAFKTLVKKSHDDYKQNYAAEIAEANSTRVNNQDGSYNEGPRCSTCVYEDGSTKPMLSLKQNRPTNKTSWAVAQANASKNINTANGWYGFYIRALGALNGL